MLLLYLLLMFEASWWVILPAMHILVEQWVYWFPRENDSSNHEYIGWAMRLLAPWIMGHIEEDENSVQVEPHLYWLLGSSIHWPFPWPWVYSSHWVNVPVQWWTMDILVHDSYVGLMFFHYFQHLSHSFTLPLYAFPSNFIIQIIFYHKITLYTIHMIFWLLYYIYSNFEWINEDFVWFW